MSDSDSGGLFDGIKSALGDVEGVVSQGEAIFSGPGGTSVQGPTQSGSPMGAVKAFPWILVGLGAAAILLVWYMRKK